MRHVLIAPRDLPRWAGMKASIGVSGFGALSPADRGPCFAGTPGDACAVWTRAPAHSACPQWYRWRHGDFPRRLRKPPPGRIPASGPPAIKQRQRTPRKDPFLPCSHLDFESAVTAQNDEFKVVFDSSYSRLVNVKTDLLFPYTDTAEIRFLPCGHLDFESAVTAQNDEFKGSFQSSYSRLAKKLNTLPRYLQIHSINAIVAT